METLTADAPDGPVYRTGFAQQMATRAAFFAAGFCMSAWAPLIPYARARLVLDDGRLGLLLLCLGTGSVIAMPMAGMLAGRYGCRAVIATVAVLACLMLPILATAGSITSFAAALLCFGASIGTLDVVMNIQAALVERDSGRAMMSGFHGLYSVGGIVGAGGMSLMTSTGLSLLPATLVIVAATLVIVGVSYTSLLRSGGQTGGQTGGPAFALPHGHVVLLGLFCFVLFLAEGSVLDWSAVFLTTHRAMKESSAGLGYVAFATAMTTCRLAGDWIVHHIGPKRVVLFGGLCAATGFLLAVSVPSAIVGIIGFGLVGVGASNVVPVMFSAAGRQTAMPANLAIASITTLGYAGILLGPAMIGLFANLFGLAVGIGIVGAMVMSVALISTRVRL